MSIDARGEWWVGSEASDIDQYLRSYATEGYTVGAFRLCSCPCGSVTFNLDADDNEGCAKRTCAECSVEHFICDSEEYWSEADPERCKCIECGTERVNVGVGFSLYQEDEPRSDVRWLYVGVRCVGCGVLGCFAGWKVAYSPSAHLLNSA